MPIYTITGNWFSKAWMHGGGKRKTFDHGNGFQRYCLSGNGRFFLRRMRNAVTFKEES